ncbi:large conductance mechanosensitive channel protein MscL [Parelusimicrobium proximum]|uniref:large conductance mechanosensitive channel protein MscL n=1 Tax=Parelusimicrobium proximum TaxID=3228953 RepID=UPI003D177FA3
MLKEFRDFAVKGNVMDMAVGIIIGGAFGKIVNSLVSDIIMPPIGYMLGKVDFSNLFVVIKHAAGTTGSYPSLAAAQAAGAITINIGLFLNTIISFLIVAFSVFLLVKSLNKLRKMTEKEQAAAEPTTKKCPFCYTDIPIQATKCPNCTADLNK